MELKTIKRQNQDEQKFIELLTSERLDLLNENDVDFMQRYHIENGILTQVQKEYIKRNSLWVFAKNDKKMDKNQECLQLINTKTNPVAKIFPQSTQTNGKSGVGVKSHFNADIGNTPTLLCLGAKVHIQGRNFKPR